MTVEDLMEDRVALDGVLLKCDQNPAKVRADSECLNARIAAERLAKDHEHDPNEDKKRQEAFERRREELRLAQEKLRQDHEAKTKVDAYSLPVVPVDPAAPPSAATPPNTTTPTVAGTATP